MKRISLIVTLIMIMSIPSFVFADTIATSGSGGNSSAVISQSSTNFNVIIPTTLPISVDSKGIVTVADNAKVINNSKGPICIVSKGITPLDGWNFTDSVSNKIGKKDFKFDMNFSKLKINPNDEALINYNSLISPQKEQLLNKVIANITIIVNWDLADIADKGDGTIIRTWIAGTDAASNWGPNITGTLYANGTLILTGNGNMNTFSSVSGARTLNQSDIKKVYIDDNITGSIANAFKGCSNLVYCHIPNGITNLNATFASCTSLVNTPDIPNSVLNMANTFAYCSNLTTISNIPDSVTSMLGTFYCCTSLVNPPILSKNVTNLMSTFYGCTSLISAPVIPTSIQNPDNSYSGVSNVEDMFRGCSNLTGNVVVNSTLINRGTNILTNTIKPIILKYPISQEAYWNTITVPANVTKIPY